jgi:hypothetical protein
MLIIKFLSNNKINHVSGNFSDYTLCGISLDENEPDDDDVLCEYVQEEGKITCKKCIAIIKYCKSIKL